LPASIEIPSQGSLYPAARYAQLDSSMVKFEIKYFPGVECPPTKKINKRKQKKVGVVAGYVPT
jgi:hypothetical protein